MINFPSKFGFASLTHHKNEPITLLSATKAHCLTWVGILGGALTLFSNLQGFLDFAAWAKWLTDVWGQFVLSVWGALLERFAVRFDPQALLMMTMAIFVSCLAIGARLSVDGKNEDWPVRLSNILHWNVFIAIILYVAISSLPQLYYQFPVFGDVTYTGWLLLVGAIWLGYVCAIIIGLWRWPFTHAVVVAVTMVVFSEIFGGAPLRDKPVPNIPEIVSTISVIMFAVICGLIVLVFAPPRAFARRLIFVLLGVILLVGMSEISKLGLTVAAPSE